MLEWGGWSTPRPGCFTHQEGPGTHWTGGRMSPRARLDGCGKGHSLRTLHYIMKSQQSDHGITENWSRSIGWTVHYIMTSQRSDHEVNANLWRSCEVLTHVICQSKFHCVVCWSENQKLAYLVRAHILSAQITSFSVLNVYSWPTSSEVTNDPLKYIKCQITVEAKY